MRRSLTVRNARANIHGFVEADFAIGGDFGDRLAVFVGNDRELFRALDRCDLCVGAGLWVAARKGFGLAG